jgi:hypothetical protein
MYICVEEEKNYLVEGEQMMRRFSAFLISLILFLAPQYATAGITGWNCDDDGDGAIVMNYNSIALTPVGSEYDLSMTGAQYWYPAHVAGDFTTDGDPIVRIIEDVSNDTSFNWTDYHITFGMTQSFSFITSGLLAPAGWNASVTLVTAGNIPNGGPMGYVGTINYVMGSGGSPVIVGDTGTFGFKVSFLGNANFSTEQIPTPEPATIALLGLGGVALLRRRIA